MDKIRQTFKSGDTEEWLDKVWTRPIGYCLAVAFARLGIHPNAVTVASMAIGAGSALFFAHGSHAYEGMEGLLFNLTAIAMLAVANFLDSADGQLARMTGKKTRLGRILDGAASEVWFVPIYLSIVYRFYLHHDMEFRWLGIADTPQNTLMATAALLALVLVSGFGCHSGQCGMADYYRQIHLFFLKGEAGSELDNAAAQKALYDSTPWRGNIVWKAFLYTYIGYTRKQERLTPWFQKMMRELRGRYGAADKIPQEFRDDFRRQSLPLMRYTNILTFNTRAVALYLLCLADVPSLYFLFETVAMSALCEYMRRRHERMCRKLLYALTNTKD